MALNFFQKTNYRECISWLACDVSWPQRNLCQRRSFSGSWCSVLSVCPVSLLRVLSCPHPVLCPPIISHQDTEEGEVK